MTNEARNPNDESREAKVSGFVIKSTGLRELTRGCGVLFVVCALVGCSSLNVVRGFKIEDMEGAFYVAAEDSIQLEMNGGPVAGGVKTWRDHYRLWYRDLRTLGPVGYEKPNG